MTSTYVYFLLDRSGSMASCLDATIEGVNAYFATLAATPTPIFVTLRQFDSEGTDTIALDRPAKEVVPLTKETYVPRGGTPLVDAAYSLALVAEARLHGPAGGTVPKVVIVIQTDGQENASRLYTTAQLKEKLETLQGRGVEVVFMGADINAYAEANKFGINPLNTLSYPKTHTTQAFYQTASNTASYASGASHNMGYSGKQKADSGDTAGS